MSDNDRYKPIPCEVYDGYEIAIMHHQKLRVVWRDESNQHHISNLKPFDLQTRNGEEFLIAVNETGSTIRIRLDHINSSKPITKMT